MRWFRKAKPREVSDEPISWPIGDIEAAKRIRDICRAAAANAVGGRSDEGDRYKRAAKAAMEIAIKMSDDLMRDAAVREIVSLCLLANDVKTAQILFRAIQAVAIREEVLNEHPILRQ